MNAFIASLMTVVMALIAVPVPLFSQETFDCDESKKMGSDDAFGRPLAAGWFLIGVGTGGHERLMAENAKHDPEDFFDRPFR